MTPRMQTFKHDPANGIYGDCARTCIAALLDIPNEDVPHFLHDNPELAVFNKRLDGFLATHNLARIVIAFKGCPIEEFLNIMKHNYGKHYLTLAGRSSIGVNHAVIICEGEIVMDPSGNGITGPCDDGLYYIEALVDLRFTKQE